jgi:hypothetical protein
MAAPPSGLGSGQTPASHVLLWAEGAGAPDLGIMRTCERTRNTCERTRRLTLMGAWDSAALARHRPCGPTSVVHEPVVVKEVARACERTMWVEHRFPVSVVLGLSCAAVVGECLAHSTMRWGEMVLCLRAQVGMHADVGGDDGVFNHATPPAHQRETALV